MSVWRPGQNLPALSSDPNGLLQGTAAQLVGNLFTNLDALPKKMQVSLYASITGQPENGRARRVSTERLVASLLGVNRWRILKWKRIYDDPSVSGDRFDAAAPFGTPGEEPSTAHSLPEVAEPESEGDSDNEMVAASGASSNDDVLPDLRGGLLDKWRKYDQYVMGMRLAELSVMWHVNGWSSAEFPCFVSWASNHFPHAFGNINHSRRFLDNFLPSIVMATHQCLSSSLHACIPALGLPSFLTRVIDVVSIHGRSLLPTIYVYTNPNGQLSWALLGCPCLEYRQAAFGADKSQGETKTAASGASSHDDLFGFHKAPQLVTTVHNLEKTFHITRDDRAMRLISTVADNAVQGPGSVHFTDHERRVDNLEPDILSEAVCQFHAADTVGGSVDKLFFETLLYDRMLRLVRRHFAWGTGDLILRAVANKFSSLAEMHNARSEQLRHSAADAEAKGQPLAAERLAKRAQKSSSEATALRMAGWTQWFRPRAPKADGTRKVVWQSKTREFFSKFTVWYTGVFWPACSKHWSERATQLQSKVRLLPAKQECKPAK